MVSGGNTNNVENRRRVQREVMGNGRCGYCPPHQRENEGHRDGKWLYDSDTRTATFRASKPKHRK